MPCLVRGKNRQALALIVFKNDSLWGWGHEWLGNREAGEWNGLGDEVARGSERAIAESKIQVSKRFRRR